MEQEIKVFVALVKSEITNVPPKQEIVDAITPEMIKALYLIAQKHDMVYLVAVALKRLNLLKDHRSSRLFREHIYATLVRYELIKNEQEQMYQMFEKEGIAFIPLKGAVIRGYYPEPWIRTSCDIDILVKKEDLTRAKQALVSSLHYTVRKHNYHDISLYSPSNVHLELHFMIEENEKNVDPILKKVWNFANPIEPERYHYELTPEYLYFHAIAHMYYHFINGGCGARFVLDSWLLENRLAYDEKQFALFCRMCGLEQFVASVKKLSRVWFEEEEHDAITRDMEKYIITGGVFGSIETKVMARKTETSSRGLYLWKRIWMPYKEACASFPKIEKCPALYPFYSVKRWFKLLDKNTVKQAKEEIRLNQDMTEEQIQQMRALFEQLDLK